VCVCVCGLLDMWRMQLEIDLYFVREQSFLPQLILKFKVQIEILLKILSFQETVVNYTVKTENL